MRELIADLRYAARTLLANPTFAASAVLTLGIGIGMTTAVFSFLNAVVLQPLPLRNADRLITICEQYPGSTPDWCSVAPPNIADIKERSKTIEAIGIGRSWPVSMSTADGAVSVPAGIASDGMFEALGIRAEQGRLIQPTDLLGRASTVAVISHAMWEKDFASASDIVGRSVALDGAPVTIVGVLEPSASVPLFSLVKLWRPLHIDPRDEQNREWRGFVAYARLREGVSLAAARADLAGIVRDLRTRHFSTTPSWDLTPQTLHDLVVGGYRTPLLLFLSAVTVVLLIACANVANLLLARGAARGREMAVRSAIGASRPRIVRSLLVESLVIAMVGAVIGIGVAEWATQAFRALAPEGIPRIDQVRTSVTVLLFTAAVAVVASMIFGLVPALRISGVDLATSLRDGGRGGSGRGGRLGRLLVVAEVAIALPLVTSAALLSRSFIAQMEWRPGFERDHLLTFSMFLPPDAATDRASIAQTWSRLEKEIAGIPGVKSVGTASAGPLFGGRETWEMQIEGRPASERPSIRWFDVGPGFFAMLGVPVVRGRDLDATDVLGSPESGLVNETLANRYWPGENPIGKHLMFPHGDDRATFTVKGVVRDVPPIRAGSSPEPELYWSNRQEPRAFTYFVVRTSVPPATVSSAIRERFRAVNRDFKIRQFTTMTQRVEAELRVPRFSMTLVVAFGLAALVLAGIGTYGLLAYFVEQRRREIGIRLALGAQRTNVVHDVVQSGLTLALPGIAIGIAASMALSRAIRGFLSGVSPLDPVSVSISAGAVLAVVVVACGVPAWRASRVDPAVTLVAD